MNERTGGMETVKFGKTGLQVSKLSRSLTIASRWRAMRSE